MARYKDAQCKLCRREGEKLFLKGSRCHGDKCAFERRAYSPGQRGRTMRRRGSEYALRLREKQKLRRIYGILEKQFRNYFHHAAKQKGVTGANLLRMLECRLDNLTYRLGFAPSRKAARQLVLHRHFMVNERMVSIPSYQVKPGDVMAVHEKSKKLDIIHQALREGRAGDLPYLSLDKALLRGELLEYPKRTDIPLLVQEQLVVELYSK
ncbi:MAG: 30S ribosomal protein S4 [Candidatus Zixiibacteriota bacterium]|jgi:small subunit ribosomal protein S4